MARAQTRSNSDTTIIVRFDDNPDGSANAQLLAFLDCSIEWRSKLVEGLSILRCHNKDAPSVAQILSNLPNVKYAEQSSGLLSQGASPECSGYGVRTSLPQSGPLYGLQWAVQNLGQDITGVKGYAGEDLDVCSAWSRFGEGSPNVVVSVVDLLGVDIDHPAMKLSLWTNPGELPDGVDNDGNGIVDDIHGVSYGDPELLGRASGDPRPIDAGPSISWSHGTAAAGLIFGSHDTNYSRILGVAPGCRLLSIRLWSGDTWSDEYREYSARAIRALEYSILSGAQISSWSIEIDSVPSAGFEDILNSPQGLTHIVVAAAGNEYKNIDVFPYYPASYGRTHANVIAVAALDHRGCLAKYEGSAPGSSWGPNSVFVAAPGWQNVSTGLYVNNVPYFWFDGTSAATPHVAGALALLLSQHPELSPQQVRNRILLTGRSEASLVGTTITGKAIDIKSLLEAH